MLFEFDIIFNLLKTHLADLSLLIDAGVIVYVIHVKRELNKKANIADLEVLKKYISDLFKHEINNIKGYIDISNKAVDDQLKTLQTVLLAQINSIKIH